MYPPSLSVTKWIHKDGIGSDLESVYSIPETENEFLIAESGKWEGNYGRMFYIRLKEKSREYNAEVQAYLFCRSLMQEVQRKVRAMKSKG